MNNDTEQWQNWGIEPKQLQCSLHRQLKSVSQEVSDKYRKDEKDDGLVSATVAHQPN